MGDLPKNTVVGIDNTTICNENCGVPLHVAIIMDGNGRWAEKNGYERSYGHFMGVNSVKEVIDQSLQSGVRCLTLYAFSSENWSRPSKEVEYLMELFCSTITEQKELLKEKGVRVLFVGRREELSEKVVSYVDICEKETVDNSTMTLVIALNYSSRNEIIDATKLIAQRVADGKLNIEDINEEVINNSLYTQSLPDPDLVIRTSGECRLSNFLLWQCSYSEFYFTDILWPDFGKKQYIEALEAYAKRKRRFGNI